MDPHAVVRGGGEEYCQAVVPERAVFARVFREEPQSESTLVREHSKPVGSGRFRDRAQDPIESWARLLPLPLLAEKMVVLHTHRENATGRKMRCFLSCSCR